MKKLKHGTEGLLRAGKRGALRAGYLDLSDFLHHKLEDEVADAGEREEGEEDQSEDEIW